MADRYNRPDAGISDWHIPLNENFARLAVDVEHRDIEANSGNYEPRAGAKFFATDTGAVYVGDGEVWKSTNTSSIYDSSGRYLGRLTGSADASTVQDAIADRTRRASVVLPNPGFALDWDRQVDLPADDPGFCLGTMGLPRLTIPSEFSGNSAIHKPSSTATIQSVTGYRIGGVRINDLYGELSWGITLDDVKESIIQPSVFHDTPGIRIRGTNHYSNQNLILKPYIRSARGPGILLENTLGGSRADQNWVFAPHFNDKGNGTETAYRDEANDNSWLFTRGEFAREFHVFDNASGYYVTEGDWDRTHDARFSVREIGDSEGNITIRHPNRYEKMRLVGNNTVISGSGDSFGNGSINPSPVDILDGLKRATTAHSLAALGLRDNSTGGSVSLHSTFYNHPFIRLETGSTAGNTAVMDLGDGALKTQSFPKVAFAMDQRDTQADTSGVVVRLGCVSDLDNRVELIYDPTNELGGHTSGNWWFELVTGGKTRAQVDMGVGPSGDQSYAFNREDAGGNDVWSAAVDRKNLATGSTGGTDVGKGTWRWYLKTLESDDKCWDIHDKYGMRFYRF